MEIFVSLFQHGFDDVEDVTWCEKLFGFRGRDTRVAGGKEFFAIKSERQRIRGSAKEEEMGTKTKKKKERKKTQTKAGKREPGEELRLIRGILKTLISLMLTAR